jgi:guanylate kinase
MNAIHDARLVIISGPSGAGKSTVVRQLMAQCHLPLQLSVSATTRLPRPGENDGQDYYFLSRDEFERRRRLGEFLECKEVFGRGDWYGTLRSEVERKQAGDGWVILEIDVQGALSVLQECPRAATIFLHPGSPQELERRLRLRATESEESIRRRLEVAHKEMEFLRDYRFEVVNHTIEQAVQEICDILKRLGGECHA